MLDCCSAWLHSSAPLPCMVPPWLHGLGLSQGTAEIQALTGRFILMGTTATLAESWKTRQKHHFLSPYQTTENCSEPSLICSHGFQLPAKLIKYQRQILRETSDTLIGLSLTENTSITPRVPLIKFLPFTQLQTEHSITKLSAKAVFSKAALSKCHQH